MLQEICLSRTRHLVQNICEVAGESSVCCHHHAQAILFVLLKRLRRVYTSLEQDTAGHMLLYVSLCLCCQVIVGYLSWVLLLPSCCCSVEIIWGNS